MDRFCGVRHDQLLIRTIRTIGLHSESNLEVHESNLASLYVGSHDVDRFVDF